MLKKLFAYFKTEPDFTANIARERLSMIVSHKKAPYSVNKDYIVQIQEELFRVINKYFSIVDDNCIEVKLETKNNIERLEINVELPS